MGRLLTATITAGSLGTVSWYFASLAQAPASFLNLWDGVAAIVTGVSAVMAFFGILGAPD